MKAAGAATRCSGGTTSRSAWDTLGRFPEEAFAPSGSSPPIDWVDTAESQRILNYQNFTPQDYVKAQQAALGPGRLLVPLVAPLGSPLAAAAIAILPILQEGQKATGGVSTNAGTDIHSVDGLWQTWGHPFQNR